MKACVDWMATKQRSGDGNPFSTGADAVHVALRIPGRSDSNASTCMSLTPSGGLSLVL